ncbi:MAG TPA: transglycosylase SLT domain-containing protein [Sporichthyaceae bacterium]|nr:transglycosylase SLT domain-containing protein [Sporichthyaceae bacterium]
MGYSSRGGRRGFRSRVLAAVVSGLLLGGSITGVATGAASVVPVAAGTQFTVATNQVEETGAETGVSRQLRRHHHRYHHHHRRHHHRRHHHRQHHRYHHRWHRGHRHHHRWHHRHHHHRWHYRHHRWYRHRWYHHRWHYWHRHHHWHHHHHWHGNAAVRRARARAIAHRLVHNSYQFTCFAHVIEHESSWNPLARNRSSGAYGLPQALPARKLASAGGDWRTNPRTQIRWAIHYMDHRYGSACNAWHFWRHHHWY